MDERNNVSDENLAGVYELVAKAIGKRQTQGIGIEEVNKRCLCNISSELGDNFSEVAATIADGLNKSKRIVQEVDALPDVMNKELKELPEKLKLPLLESARQKVMTLLAQLHAAAEDPAQLYPRLLCGSIPVDPAKVTKFSKQYRILERLNDLDERIGLNDRSLSGPPKSSEEVLTNVVASAEIISNTVLEPINQMSGLEKDFKEIKEFAATLLELKAPLDELLNLQEEAYGTMRRLTAMFLSEEERSEDTASEEVEQRAVDRGILQTVRACSGLLDNTMQSRNVLDDSVLRIHSFTGLFAQQMDSLQARFERIHGMFESLANVLKQFVANLPRLAREIRQFFVPTGWRSYIMRPSDDLLSLLAGIEDLTTSFPDPNSLYSSVIENLDNGDLVGTLKKTKENIEEATCIPSKLLDTVQEQDFQQRIIASVRNTLLSALDELLSSAVDEMKENVEDVIGKYAERVEDFFPLNSSPDNRSAPTKSSNEGVFQKFASDIQTTGLFKAIF
ncbi:hypothetical protein FGB62_33g185 [Gracilaria domingensis]|nr:hypothetical protein FGB62_33g185 [Gracilaria domingensis]